MATLAVAIVYVWSGAPVWLYILGATLFALVATWILVRSLRRGEDKRKSFKLWMRMVLDALWGLG